MRPHIYRTAAAFGLRGEIRNEFGDLRAMLIGPTDAIDGFLDAVESAWPEGSRIDTREMDRRPYPTGGTIGKLCVAPSRGVGSSSTAVPPDTYPCRQCAREFRDADDRRYLYPFIACSHCGPRYTVLSALPYDRENTTMSDFPLCDACRKEYRNPDDRRFHAEMTCCPDCGPALTLFEKHRNRYRPTWTDIRHPHDMANLFRYILRLLDRDCVLALKGTGGYQLLCNGTRARAVDRLRRIKRRPTQALAVMVGAIDSIREQAWVSPEAEQLLISRTRPIAILPAKRRCSSRWLSFLIRPDTAATGFMLPSTLLHQLLFTVQYSGMPRIPYIVVTSANLRGSPIIIDERDILRAGMADAVLVHNRRIVQSADDAVYFVFGRDRQSVHLSRPGRGVAPYAMVRKRDCDSVILAMGADLKNATGLWMDRQMILSPNNGDLFDAGAIHAYEGRIGHFLDLYDRRPDTVVADMHPGLFSHGHGRSLAEKYQCRFAMVQHHEAHARAAMAEFDLTDSLAVVFDGTGYGTDGTMWGGEFLYITETECRRFARLKPFPLPGIDEAIRHPWRQAAALAVQAAAFDPVFFAFRFGRTIREISAVAGLARSGRYCIWSSGAGRLADAVAAVLLPFAGRISYESEAPIRLQRLAELSVGTDIRYPMLIEKRKGGLLEIDSDAMFACMLGLLQRKAPTGEMALAFHHWLADICVGVLRLMETPPMRNVVLSGGVFQNGLLLTMVRDRMERDGFRPHIPEVVPVNDAGIAIGQIECILRRSGHA